MADTVKSNRICLRPTITIDDYVSVPPIFFGQGYSSAIPSWIDKIYGRVIYIHDGSVKG